MHSHVKKIIKNIQLLQIQGASAIVKSSIKALIFLIENIQTRNVKEFIKIFLVNAQALSKARPTEPYVQNFYFYIHSYLNKNNYQDVKDLKIKLTNQLNIFLDNLNDNDNLISQYGKKLIKPGMNVLTHCHSSVVEKVLVEAHKEKKYFKVFADETRPLYQGRITAKNLTDAGIDTTQIADSASGFLISSFSGKDLMMDLIIVGADVICSDGSIINKIGTYDIAASAYLNNIPFYVAASLLKIDLHNKIQIEKRSGKELWPNKPVKIKILNFAFDLVPAEYITGIITEFGIIKPKKVKQVVIKKYPWLG